MAAFPHHVFDAAYALLGTFDEADEAHRFAHDASREPGARLPVEVADFEHRTSRLVWPQRCEAKRWMALDRDDPCPVAAAYPAGVGAPTG